MSCRAATGASRIALKRLGYVVEDVVPPESGKIGEVRAVRRVFGTFTGEGGTAYDVVVRLSCDDSGSIVEAATEEPFSDRLAFRRDFPVEFERALARTERRRRSRAERPDDAQKLRVSLQPLYGSAATDIVGGAAETVGVTPVRVEITNRSDLRYRLELERFKLISEAGARNRPMTAEQVRAAVPPEWRDRVARSRLSDAEIAPGQSIGGYLFVPAAAYRRAKVILIETVSDEAEGFTVEF